MTKILIIARAKSGFVGPAVERLEVLRSSLKIAGKEVEIFESPIFHGATLRKESVVHSNVAALFKTMVKSMLHRLLPKMLKGSIVECFAVFNFVRKNKTAKLAVVSVPPFLLIWGLVLSKTVFRCNFKIILDFRDLPVTDLGKRGKIAELADVTLLRILNKKINEIWVVSNHNKLIAERYSTRRVLLVRNGISQSSIAKISTIKGLVKYNNGSGFIFYAGAMDQVNRNLEIVIDAMVRERSGLKLLLATKQSAEAHRIINYAKKFRIHVEYIGVLEREEVWRYTTISYANLIVEPSWSSDSKGNIPVKVFELLVSGRPISLFGVSATSELREVLQGVSHVYENELPGKYVANVESCTVKDMYIRENIFSDVFKESVING